MNVERDLLLRGLEVFKENVRSGVDFLVAKHLYRAGVYFASLDNGLTKNLLFSDVIESLRRRLRDRNARLFVFMERNRELVSKQGELIDVESLLRRILRQGSRAVGLLEGVGERELQEAERLLERFDRMERYFAKWSEVIVPSSTTYYRKIVDMHD